VAGIQRDIHTDRQAGRHTYILSASQGGHTHIQTYIHTDSGSDRQRDIQSYRHTDRQTDIHTCRHSGT